MYAELRSEGFGYETVVPMMENHQSMWPEAIWNEDAYNKYLEPLILNGEDYLAMNLGDKKSHRDWWMFNGFRYRDSKYQCGDAKANSIKLRGYALGDITITPYSHIYPWIKYAQTDVYERGYRNTPYTLKCPLDKMNDTEIFIYSADRIADISGLEALNVGTADFSAATKLQSIVVGSAAEGFQNTQLNSLTIGNNELLTLIDVQNCVNLTTPIDASGCIGLEVVKANGSKLTGINLPDGGHLRVLELPATVSNFTIKNQKNIESLTFEGQENITTLSIEGTPNLDIEGLVNNSPNLNWVRLIGVEWTATDSAALQTVYDKLKNCQGLDATGNQITKPVVNGKVYIDAIEDELLEEINDTFPELTVVVDGVAKFFVKFVNYDNTLLYRYLCSEGDTIVDPVKAGTIEEPTRENTDTGVFYYRGWSVSLPLVAEGKAYNIIARYDSTYLCRFYDYTGENVLYSKWVAEGGTVDDPVLTSMILTPTKPDTEKYTYTYTGWDQPLTDVSGPMNYKPLFDESLRSFAVFFMNGSEQLQRSNVLYGNYATYFGDESEIKKTIDGEPSDYYEFQQWSPSPAETPITTTQYFYAKFAFDGYIEDDWDTIAANCASGNTEAYGLGGRKTLEVTIGSSTATWEMEIVGKDHDTLADSEVSSSYNNGAATAGLTFLAYAIPDLQTSFSKRSLNSSLKGDTTTSATLATGGWEICDEREWFETTFLPALPVELQGAIKTVVKISDLGVYNNPELNETEDKLWIPSQTEVNGGTQGNDVLGGQGTAYPLFTDTTSRQKGAKYFTRSTSTSIHCWKAVTVNGDFIAEGGGNSQWLIFGFCI